MQMYDSATFSIFGQIFLAYDIELLYCSLTWIPNISPPSIIPSSFIDDGAISDKASTVVDAGKSKSPFVLNVLFGDFVVCETTFSITHP